MSTTIAFLGLGRMGRELAIHLIAAGHRVTVWNRSPGAAQDLGGATIASTAAEAVTGAEVVFTALFGPDAVREVVLEGELPFAPDATWIDVTTVSPADAEEFAGFAVGAGIRYAHSPVIGSIGPARAGALTVLIGGTDAAVATVRPLVSLWAAPDRVTSYDTAAKAAAGKLVANLALAVSMQGVVEALRLGSSAGLDAGEVLDTLATSMLAPITAAKGATVRGGGYSETQFSTDLLAKDARLMLQSSALPLPALSAAFAALVRESRAGHGDDDFSVIAAGDAA